MQYGDSLPDNKESVGSKAWGQALVIGRKRGVKESVGSGFGNWYFILI